MKTLTGDAHTRSATMGRKQRVTKPIGQGQMTCSDTQTAEAAGVASSRQPTAERREAAAGPGCACPACGDVLRKVGEGVTEILEYGPGRFEVVRHVRPAFSCRTCEAMTQAPMPSLPIERGRPGPGLLTHVLVSTYCDHLPLYCP